VTKFKIVKNSDDCALLIVLVVVFPPAIRDDIQISDTSYYEAITMESVYGMSGMTIISHRIIGDHHILLDKRV